MWDGTSHAAETGPKLTELNDAHDGLTRKALIESSDKHFAALSGRLGRQFMQVYKSTWMQGYWAWLGGLS